MPSFMRPGLLALGQSTRNIMNVVLQSWKQKHYKNIKNAESVFGKKRHCDQ